MTRTSGTAVAGVLLSLVLGACATPASRALNACTEPRPEVCTREYRPVCGHLARSGALRTYGNDCEACADPAVAGWLPGACPD